MLLISYNIYGWGKLIWSSTHRSKSLTRIWGITTLHLSKSITISQCSVCGNRSTAIALLGIKGSELGIDFVLCRARPALLIDRQPRLPLFFSCFSDVGVQSSIALATRLSGLQEMYLWYKKRKTSSEFHNCNRLIHDTVVCLFKLYTRICPWSSERNHPTSLTQLQFSSASANTSLHMLPVTSSLKRSKKIYCVQLRQYGTMQVCEIRTLDVEYVDASSMPWSPIKILRMWVWSTMKVSILVRSRI